MTSDEWRVASDGGGVVRSYRDLQVWRRSLDFAEAVYAVSRGWPSDKRFGLTSQARRAAVSVSANIAEGAGRRRTGELLQFLGIARGSLAETESLLILSARLGFTSDDALRDALQIADEISRMLSGLSGSLQSRGAR